MLVNNNEMLQNSSSNKTKWEEQALEDLNKAMVLYEQPAENEKTEIQELEVLDTAEREMQNKEILGVNRCSPSHLTTNIQ